MMQIAEKVEIFQKNKPNVPFRIIPDGSGFKIRPLEEGTIHDQKIAETYASREGFVLIDDRIIGYEDPIIQSACKKMKDRSTVGLQKYGMTLDMNTKYKYLLALQEEMMDGINYIEVLLKQNSDIVDMIKHYPNDQDLGKKIREIYGL